MVDICVSVTEMNILSSIAAGVMVLDHHMTNAAAFADQSWPNVDLYFEMDTPGCWLAHRFVHGFGAALPKALRDVWKHKEVLEAVYFTSAFECPKTWADWIPYLMHDNFADMEIKGKILYDYQQSVLKTMSNAAQYTTWRGYRMAIVNVPYPWISDIGDLLCGTDKNTIAVVWNKQAMGPFNVSLRSIEPNVAKIAAEFGGGGHEHAAGFRSEQPPYEIFK